MSNRYLIFPVVLLLVLAACRSSKQVQVATPSHYFGAYTLNDAKFGTKTSVRIDADKRNITTNALPNHVTGAFPNEGNPNKISAQNISYSMTIHPTYIGNAVWAREQGVALNGIKFEPETAEAVVCETGERYRIEAKQSLVNLGLDDNNAHVQPTGTYHYHGVPNGLIATLASTEDLIHIGFALDGFPMYYSRSGKYKPSFKLSSKARVGSNCAYTTPRRVTPVEIANSIPNGTYISDWEYVAKLGDLDECNGITIDGKYMYLVTDVYPYVGRCLMGEYTPERKGPPQGGGRSGERGQRPPRGQGPPNGGGRPGGGE